MNTPPPLEARFSFKDRLFALFAGKSRRQLLISISSLAGSGMIGVALRFIGGIIQGRFVEPQTLGYYTMFTILPGYLFFLHMGVFTSLARQYPYYLGLGRKEIAVNYASNALGYTRFLCALHALGFAVPCIWALLRRDWPAALGWGSQIIVTTTTLYMFYLGSTYRNSNEFVCWSKATVISSFISLLFLPLVVWHQFVGVCARYSMPGLFSMLYAHIHRPLKIKPCLEFQVLRRMMSFGAPLMIFAYISTNLWTAVERSYILKQLNAEMLGVFTFAGTLCLALTTTATSISQVFNPRIAILYGASGKDISTTFRYCVKGTLAGSAIMLPLILATFWLIDPLVSHFLPKYVQSIAITRYLCWLSLIPVLDLPKQLLMVAKRTKQYGLSVLSSFGLFLIFLVILVVKNEPVALQTIAMASVGCKLFSVAVSYVMCWNAASETRARRRPVGVGGAHRIDWK